MQIICIIDNMKIAFVGKGGSGKSTIASLFIKHSLQQGSRVLAIDADLNMHLSKLLHITDSVSSLTDSSASAAIKTYVQGDNPRITSPESIINTTPPGKGSRLVTLDESNELLNKIAYRKDKLSFLQVGVPIQYDLGIRCYHVNMEIAETLLAHTNEGSNDYVVVDMTAGADAFATSMYAHFDLLFLVVEPTVESTSVLEDYLRLGQEFGIADRIKAIANKVETDSDHAYLQKYGDTIAASLPYLPDLRRSLRDGLEVQVKSYPAIQQMFDQVQQFVLSSIKVDKNKKLKRLQALHKIISQKPHNVSAFGDLSQQIDPEFVFKD